MVKLLAQCSTDAIYAKTSKSSDAAKELQIRLIIVIVLSKIRAFFWVGKTVPAKLGNLLAELAGSTA